MPSCNSRRIRVPGPLASGTALAYAHAFSLVRATRWPVGQNPISRPQNFPVIGPRCLSRLTRESSALPDLQIDDKAVQSPFKDNKIILKVADKDAPDALAFVVKCDEPEEWFNGPGGDFWMDFKPMDPNCIGKMIIQREVQKFSLSAFFAGPKDWRLFCCISSSQTFCSRTTMECAMRTIPSSRDISISPRHAFGDVPPRPSQKPLPR
jgi:hypothetical protein